MLGGQSEGWGHNIFENNSEKIEITEITEQMLREFVEVLFQIM